MPTTPACGAPTEPPLKITLLGLFGVNTGDAPVADIHARSGDRVLAYLVLHKLPVHRQSVASAVWPETGSLDSLRQCISTLRRNLGPHKARLITAGDTMSFDTAGVSVDALQFDADAESGDAERLDRALAAYAGELLPGWQDAWVVEMRADYARRFRAAVHSRSHLHAAQGGFRLAVDLVESRRGAGRLSEDEWLDIIEWQVRGGERILASELVQRYVVELRDARVAMSAAARERIRRVFREEDEGNETGLVGLTLGPMSLGSSRYVRRSADDALERALRSDEMFVRLQGPRWTGKSSMLARGLASARQAGATTLTAEFDSFTDDDLRTMASMCARLSALLAAHMDGDVDPAEGRIDSLGAGLNFEKFVLRKIVGALPGRVALALDNVDKLFSRDYADEFFSLLRSWHARRSTEPSRPWGRLTVALVFATDAHLYLRDLNHSPFNVGIRVDVADFTSDQISDLATRYKSTLTSADDRRRFEALVGGHPYLAHRGIQELALDRLTLDQLEQRAATEESPFIDALHEMTDPIREDSDLLQAVKSALDGKACTDVAFSRLRAAGVLRGDPSRPALRCGIFDGYLRRHL